MIRTISVRASSAPVREDAVVFPLFSGSSRPGAAAARIDRALGGGGALLLARGPFAAERGETRSASVRRGRGLLHVVLVGLGKESQANVEDIADAAGAAGRALLALGARSAAVVIDDALRGAPSMTASEVVHAFVKGIGLAPYAYHAGARARTPLQRLVLVSEGSVRDLGAAARRARRVAELTELVRDWVNTPANRMGPARFAAESRALLERSKVACRVWGTREIEKEGLGGVLAVAAGSREQPRFLIAQYNLAERKLPLVCLVGKGVTFDSGGISIKPWEKMHEMKSDMAGGAAVVAALAAAADLGLALRVVGLVPCVENMPGGGAFRPGDVLTLHSGKTVEVLTTDAEGRLILADAVSYAATHYRPEVIVDMATLTGGMVIALGTRVAGMMGTSPHHLDDMRAAGTRSGEPVWPLPLDDRFFAAIKGEISDYKNYGGRGGSPITGGAMIGAFAGKTPWVHVDIAGTSWNEGNGPSYQTRGATGYGVDLLLSFLEIVAAR